MTLSEYLAVPHVLRAESRRQQDGRWVQEVSYDQLPCCTIEVEDRSVPEALSLLERARVATIVKLLRDGRPVPCPAPPRASAYVLAELRELGLGDEFESLLGLEESELAGPQTRV